MNPSKLHARLVVRDEHGSVVVAGEELLVVLAGPSYRISGSLIERDIVKSSIELIGIGLVEKDVNGEVDLGSRGFIGLKRFNAKAWETWIISKSPGQHLSGISTCDSDSPRRVINSSGT